MIFEVVEAMESVMKFILESKKVWEIAKSLIPCLFILL